MSLVINNVNITEYAIAVPDFFIKFIGYELNVRDLPGLTNNRIKAIIPTGEHPFVQVTGAAITSGGKINFAGLLPAISIIESDEREESITMGQGVRTPLGIDQKFIDDCRTAFPKMEDRVSEGLFTNKQLSDIEQMIANNDGGPIEALVNEYWMRESVFISLWTENLQDRQIIGRLLRSIIFMLRAAMKDKGVIDSVINSSKGLVNFNFGRILHGMEFEMSFLNKFTNISVRNEKIMDKGLDILTIGNYIPVSSKC